MQKSRSVILVLFVPSEVAQDFSIAPRALLPYLVTDCWKSLCVMLNLCISNVCHGSKEVEVSGTLSFVDCDLKELELLLFIFVAA